MVKNLPANAGDPGLTPGPGRSQRPWSSYAVVPRLLSLRSGAQELQLTKPKCPRACDQQQEKPMQQQAYRESQRSNEDPAQSKIQKINNTI